MGLKYAYRMAAGEDEEGSKRNTKFTEGERNKPFFSL